jgi:hypothetical protein
VIITNAVRLGDAKRHAGTAIDASTDRELIPTFAAYVRFKEQGHAVSAIARRSARPTARPVNGSEVIGLR